MDLLYFQNPPRFQFLHMLRNEVRGGESIFVDSFAVAQRMWDEHRDQFWTLAKVSDRQNRWPKLVCLSD